MNKSVLLGLAVITVVCFAYFISYYRQPFQGKIQDRESLSGIKDTFLRSWFDHIFNVNESVIDSFENLDSALVSTKDGSSIGFIVNYHHLNPQDFIKQIRDKYRETCPIIIIDGEPDHLDHLELRDKDITVTTKYNFLPQRGFIFYVPYYCFFLRIRNNTPPSALLKDENWTPPKKTKFCVFAYSNCDKKYKGVRDREDFFKVLQQVSGGRVDNLGKCLGGGGPGINAHYKNHELFRPYKFVIVFENDQIPGYVSEKITNAMLSGAIPIYLGAPDIGLHFNKKSFINVSDFLSFHECAQYVIQVDRDDILAQSILREPWLNNNEWTADKFIYDLKENLVDVIPPQFL